MKLSKNDTAFFLCLLSWADAPIYINLLATSAITERKTAGTHHPEAEGNNTATLPQRTDCQAKTRLLVLSEQSSFPQVTRMWTPSVQIQIQIQGIAHCTIQP